MIPLKKHILIALHLYQAGGAERQAGYLAEGLKARGYQVTILAFGQADGLSYERYKQAGLVAIVTGFREKLILNTNHGLKARFLRWKYRRKLIQLVRSLHVDIILPFTYPPNVIYGWLWKKMGAKACYWNQRDEGRGFTGATLELKALEQCTGVLSNSMEGKIFLENSTSKPILIIHNGIRIPSVQAKPKQVLDEFRVVMVANLHGYKDHMTLLKAWKLLIATGAHARLLLAGKKGDTYPELKAFVDAHGLEGHVEFLGQIDKVEELLATCHLGVFSSVTEGLPNGILECMAMGLPVTATDALGSKEALGEAYPYLFADKAPHILMKHILFFYENPALRLSVGNRLRERALANFSIANMLESYEQLMHVE